MRNYFYLTLALIATSTGCAGGGFSLGHGVAQQQHPQQEQLATMQKSKQEQVAALKKSPQEPGFTQRMSDSIASFIPGMKKDSSVKQAANTASTADPISLAFKSGPPSADMYLSMAQMSDRGGNTPYARSMYQKALTIEPNHCESMLGLARLEDRQGNFQIALQIYQHAASVYPQDAKVLNDLALCYARKGDLQASAQVLHQATQLQPQKKLYRNNFAKVLIELNQIDGAIAQLSAVHSPAIVQYNMGVLLNERGRTTEAVQFLTAATHIDPQLQEASALLSQISSRGALAAAGAAKNDGVLPTPMAPTTSVAGQPYPSTNAPVQRVLQEMPAETAQAPVGEAPTLLPPVR